MYTCSPTKPVKFAIMVHMGFNYIWNENVFSWMQ